MTLIKDNVSRNHHYKHANRDERHHGRYMRDGRKSVENRRPQAPIELWSQTKEELITPIENPRLNE